MYRQRLVISLSIFLVLILLQALGTFWAFQKNSFHYERSRSAQLMLTEIVHFRADAKRLKVWLADFIITEKRDTQLRDELFDRMSTQLQNVDNLNTSLFALSQYNSDPAFARQVSQQVDFLWTNMNALKHALQTREIIQLETDAQRWQTLMTLFDKFQGSDIASLVHDLIELHKAKAQQAEQDAARMTHLLYWLLASLTLISLVLFIGLSLFLTRHFTRPLSHLLKGVQRLSSGDFSEKIPETGAKEFAELAQGFNLMANNLKSARDQQQRLQDVTEEKVQERTARLQHVVNQLHDAEIRQKNFIADVSHELRTPTTIMMGEAELALRMQPLTQSQQHATFNRIVECCQSLSSRIDDLIMLSKGQHALVSVQLSPSSILETYDHLKRQGLLLATHHQAILDVKEPIGLNKQQDSNPHLFVDHAKLDLVFKVLIENAIHYQGGELYLGIACEMQENRVIFTVTDRGVGIEEEERHAVFNRHFRGKKAQALRPDGLGLGLSLAKNILDAHDGHLVFMTNEPQGTRAEIYLPLFDLESE